jgi:hypothetical protein
MAQLLSFRCTACSFNQTSSVLAGERDYEIHDRYLPVMAAAGWCHDCDGLCLVEILPSAESLARLQEQLDRLRTRLLPRTPAHALKAWFADKARSREERFEDEVHLADLESLRDRQKDLLLALQKRESPPRCLMCSSTQCLNLPAFRMPAEGEPAAPIGFDHPGCGGQLTIEYAGVNARFRARSLTYDREGRLLANEVGLVRPIDASVLRDSSIEREFRSRSAWSFAIVCATLLVSAACLIWGSRGGHSHLWLPRSALAATLIEIALHAMRGPREIRGTARVALMGDALYVVVASLCCVGLAVYWLFEG